MGKTRRFRLVSVYRLGWKRGGGGETGRQLVEEVVSELMNDLVENIRMLNIGGDRAFASEVSGCSAPETGAWEWARLGPVNIHWDHYRKGGCHKWGERDWSTHGNRSQKHTHCTRP
jgi:hypothetical protein